MNYSNSKPKLGLLGAGHLGAAFARAWIQADAGQLSVWSRQGPGAHRDTVFSSPQIQWSSDWREVLSNDFILIALPSEPLLRLISNEPTALNYTARVYSANVALRLKLLKQLFPNAQQVRLSPFLLPGSTKIPMLGVKDPDNEHLADSVLQNELAVFGEVDFVEQEAVFERLTLLGSPLPVAIAHGITQGLEILMDTCHAQDQALGRQLLWKALAAFAESAKSGELTTIAERIASPGGITEQGLNMSHHLTEAMRFMLTTMSRHHEHMAQDTIRLKLDSL